ncbi:hypothetical protein EV196_104134 [Mariniflexile fucanivorans]|uniref:Uncharacterized protein n=1 Tax=Mariniflexile fucanivorans TaxID=264023 RepID=A0A4R1RJ18_9FLAO|nr:hypothetical protein [Mariniflexile fucanivorans]TCL66104.1 hypothetical protein EV196_104134 [Mariniflexile fucanivorans]
MKNSKNQAELLDDAMMLLEKKRRMQHEALRTQFYETSETFRPINIFNQTVKDFRESPEGKTNLFETILSISGGYFSKKLLIGKSNSWVKNLLGYALQYTVTNFISKKVHTDTEE